ncbi:MAG: hypothetical protein WAU01_13345 [Saprospiraceae bacterium]
MKKWLKRLILYPLMLLLFFISLLLLIKRDFYYNLKGIYGSQLQWFGYEEKGNRIIESALHNTKKVSAEDYHGYSVQNTKNGNYDESIYYLEKAIQLDPKDGDGYYGWVLLYYYRDYKKALFHLNRFSDSKSFAGYVGDDNIFYAIGLCHKQMKDYEQALVYFIKAIEYELKTHSEAWVTTQMYFQTGRTLQLLNQQKESLAYYDKAINRWDGSSESFYYKGLAEIELGIKTGCQNLKIALKKVEKGTKSSDMYVRLFDEIYVGEVRDMIKMKCLN